MTETGPDVEPVNGEIRAGFQELMRDNAANGPPFSGHGGNGYGNYSPYPQRTLFSWLEFRAGDTQ